MRRNGRTRRTRDVLLAGVLAGPARPLLRAGRRMVRPPVRPRRAAVGAGVRPSRSPPGRPVSCACTFGMGPCPNGPDPGQPPCVFCRQVCVPLSEGRDLFDPPAAATEVTHHCLPDGQGVTPCSRRVSLHEAA